VKKSSYMFTNKEHTQKGIMATILGVISLATLAYMVIMSYQRAGDVPLQYGAAALLSMVFAFVGIILGVISKSERDKFYLFSYLGIGLNVLVLAVLGLIFVCLYWYWAGKPQAGEACLMMAAYSISWMLGFAVPGAPGGIGVREMVLSMLLSPVMDGDVIAVLSVLHRMITVAGDFLAYLLRGRG